MFVLHKITLVMSKHYQQKFIDEKEACQDAKSSQSC